MAFTVTILGNNAALPAKGRHTTSLVVNHKEEFYLLDCGEGTQVRIADLKIKPSRLHTIFISHLHGDHYFGLVGLLTSFHLNQRKQPLTLVCPKGLQEILNLQLKYSATTLVYPLNIIEADTEKHYKVFENERLEVFTIPMEHRIGCCGYLFKEKKGLRRINAEELSKHKISFQVYNDLKEGKDFTNEAGEVIANATLTYDPQPQRSFGFCSDTVYTEKYLEIIHGADMIYHESTFLNEDEERAKERYHCTAKQAATIAKKAGVKKLLLGHFSAKYPNLELFEHEARTVFENSVASREGETYSVS